MPQALALAAQMVATRALLVLLALSRFGLESRFQRKQAAAVPCPQVDHKGHGPSTVFPIGVRLKLPIPTRFAMRFMTAPSLRSALRTRCPASGRCWSVVAAILSVSYLCASAPAFAQPDKTDPSSDKYRVSAALRSSAITLMGSSIGSIPPDRVLKAIGELMQAAIPGGFEIPTKTFPLREVERVWAEPDGPPRGVLQIPLAAS